MKCQGPFSGKNKKNISLSSAEFVQKVVKIELSIRPCWKSRRQFDFLPSANV